MRWAVHREKPLYEDEWLDIRLADVELPDGRHLQHRLIRTSPGAGCVIVKDGRVLLLWRHRFITISPWSRLRVSRMKDRPSRREVSIALVVSSDTMSSAASDRSADGHSHMTCRVQARGPAGRGSRRWVALNNPFSSCRAITMRWIWFVPS